MTSGDGGRHRCGECGSASPAASGSDPNDDALTRVVREEWGRLLALLIAHSRRLDLAEDALADAVEAAARTWPRDGVPANPAAWLHTSARRVLIDRLRTEATAARKAPLLLIEQRDRPQEGVMIDDGSAVDDDTLRLVLMCTHPALAPDVAAALALRLVIGLPTGEIARLFLVGEPTMAARITRGKKKIVAAGIPFAIPALDDLPERLDTVAQVAFIAFTAGYAAGSGPDLMRTELAGEAIHLVRVVRSLVPANSTLDGLLALMLLQHSRRDARLDADGEIVLLPDQDRNRWHHSEISEAINLLDAISAAPADAFRLQALIAAEHALAPTSVATRWDRIVAHYDALLIAFPSPAARLARAVALAEAAGPEEGLAAIADLDAGDLPGHRLPAVRAELLARCGRRSSALAAFDAALALCHNEAEHRHLMQRRAQTAGSSPGA
ncbi:MAG TPA: sigma factor [Tetrasphaera sp.]|uniref:RNA polymerase sigma factor n=1 Tax=Nostocoides sp. TaxID=1917966 RepID=UPI002B7336E9|nr:DUF6596 domain-containing protein [Tetrasphaera sp.]HNQ05812.1 sigma factor [Tetrasphaera sp.]